MRGRRGACGYQQSAGMVQQVRAFAEYGVVLLWTELQCVRFEMCGAAWRVVGQHVFCGCWDWMCRTHSVQRKNINDGGLTQ